MNTLQPNLFKRALREGRTQIGIWSTLASPYATELIAGSGYDWGLLDTEHTPSDVPLMLNQLQAAASAVPAAGAVPMEAVVRPAWNDTVLIKRYLDIGARSLLLPFVQNADEAQAAVHATRYAPAGVRGMGGSTRATNFGRTAGYVEHAHEEICLLVQVETREALDQIEAIAAIDGIDGIFIGPADLSASMGHPGKPRHPEVDAAIDDAIRRIRRAGKAPGILMADAERARACIAQGAQFVAVAMDMLLLRNGADGTAAQWRDQGAAAGRSDSY